MSELKYRLSADELEFHSYAKDALIKQLGDSWLQDQSAKLDTNSAEVASKAIEVLNSLDAHSIRLPQSQGGLGMGTLAGGLLCDAAGYSALPLPVCASISAMPIAVSKGVVSGTEWANIVHVSDANVVEYPELTKYAIIRQQDSAGIFSISNFDHHQNVLDVRRPLARVVKKEQIAELTNEAYLNCIREYRLYTAFYLLGLAQRSLDLSVRYTSERKQFGVVIGSFQAIKHQLANVKIHLTTSLPMLYRAAILDESNSEESEEILASALLLTCHAAAEAAKTCIQVHGGIGYTTEYPLSIVVKRIWSLIPEVGSRSQIVNQIVSSIKV